MAIFKKEDKEAKQAEKTAALLKKYELENLSDPASLAAIKNIALTLSANKFMDTGILLSGKAEDVAKLGYLRALVEQNFIIIRQLDKLYK